MAMKFDRFTEKAQEALLGAQTLARESNHSQIDADHLLIALLAQPDGIPVAVLSRIGANVGQLRERLEQGLSRRPKVDRKSTRLNSSH